MTKGTLMLNGVDYSNACGGSSMVNYFTEERVIGTWIDGKPLYQKTFYTENTPIVIGINEVFNLPSDIKLIVNDNVIMSNSAHDSFYHLVFKDIDDKTAGGNDLRCRIETNHDSPKLYIDARGAWPTPIIQATLQYTKTTD